MDDKKSILKWQIVTLLLLIACIIIGALLIKEKIEEARSQNAVNKAIEYINKNLVSSGTTAVLRSIQRGEISLGNLYKFTMDVNGQATDAYVSSDGKYLISANSLIYMDSETSSTPIAIADKNQAPAEGGFKELKDVNVCYENEKPIVYFFGLTTSEDSAWEYPIFKDVVSEFGEAVSFHDNYLSENGLARDQDVFMNYSPGSVPTLVIGCKYYRVGSGKDLGETGEREALTKLICNATDNKPASICAE